MDFGTAILYALMNAVSALVEFANFLFEAWSNAFCTKFSEWAGNKMKSTDVAARRTHWISVEIAMLGVSRNLAAPVNQVTRFDRFHAMASCQPNALYTWRGSISNCGLPDSFFNSSSSWIPGSRTAAWIPSIVFSRACRDGQPFRRWIDWDFFLSLCNQGGVISNTYALHLLHALSHLKYTYRRGCESQLSIDDILRTQYRITWYLLEEVKQTRGLVLLGTITNTWDFLVEARVKRRPSNFYWWWKDYYQTMHCIAVSTAMLEFSEETSPRFSFMSLFAFILLIVSKKESTYIERTSIFFKRITFALTICINRF